jgi:hypothetical protein
MSVFTRFQKPTVAWDYPLQVIEFAIQELVTIFGGPSAAAGPAAQAEMITRGARMSDDTALMAAVARAAANRTCNPGECGTQNTDTINNGQTIPSH